MASQVAPYFSALAACLLISQLEEHTIIIPILPRCEKLPPPGGKTERRVKSASDPVYISSTTDLMSPNCTSIKETAPSHPYRWATPTSTTFTLQAIQGQYHDIPDIEDVHVGGKDPQSSSIMFASLPLHQKALHYCQPQQQY